MVRIHYWNCSKFADKIRGTKKPFVLGWDEWEAWHDEARAAHPFRYFLAEKVLNKIQAFLYFPFDLWRKLNHRWSNRFFAKTHYLKTGLKPWVYHELDDRILHGLFNELKYFVEVELATLHAYGDKKYKFCKGRCPEAGIDNLKWASSLKYDKEMGVPRKDPLYGTPTPQAKSSKEILDLYEWWENRPNRPDPLDLEGEKSFRLEEKYDKEDDKMVARLIKIRRSLWT